MKRRLMAAALLLCAVVFIAAVSISAQEREVEASPQEIEAAQAAARRFVNRLMETRDVTALFDELFLQDFISHFTTDYPIPPSLYARLSQRERRRFFAATYNMHYLSAVVIMSDHSDTDFVYSLGKPGSKMLLPRSTLMKFRRAIKLLGDEETPMMSYGRFRVFLTAIEKALTEARAHLKRLEIEKTTEFQRELAPRNGLGTGVDYRVRAYMGGQNIKDCEPLTGFPENQKFFRVELPLLMGAILVRDGERMKLVRLTFVDGD
jgi:hypothetical protein